MSENESNDKRVIRVLGDRARQMSISQDAGGRVITIESDRSVTITFDDLSALAKEFETRDIDIRWNSGWGGTDVTPGDPSEFEIVITVPPPMQSTSKRKSLLNASASELPCLRCGVHHPLDEFSVGSTVRIKETVEGPGHVFGNRESIAKLIGKTGTVFKWSQYGGPLYYRIQFKQDAEGADSYGRANFDPCELEAVEATP